jgi:antitoxin YefM
MSIETSYSEARARLAELLRRASDDRETIFITRRNGAPCALIAADELASLEETAHLLRSPANARHLLEALRESLTDETVPFDVEALRARLERAVAGLGA